MVLRVFLVQLKAIPKMFRVKMVIKRAMIVAKLRKFVEKGGFHGNKKVFIVLERRNSSKTLVFRIVFWGFYGVASSTLDAVYKSKDFFVSFIYQIKIT